MTIIDDQYAGLPNGIRLHYASSGERGQPLMLFVHGFPEYWGEWQAQLEHFGATHFAVAPDLRGFNRSSKPSAVEAYRPRHIVEDLHQFIAHLGYEEAVVVAHDWGGAICWNLAIAHPEVVGKLVIINAPHPYQFIRALADPTSGQQHASAYMNWLRAPGSEQALAANDFEKLEGFFNGMGQPQATWFDAATRDRYHAAWSVPGEGGAHSLSGGVNYYRASPLHPPSANDPGPAAMAVDPAAFHVTVPTLVIWGENDLALLPSLLDGLEAHVDELRIHRIDNGTHWVVHEQPDRINCLIAAFV